MQLRTKNSQRQRPSKIAAGNESTPLADSAVVDVWEDQILPTLVEIGNGDDTITAGEVAAGEVEVKIGLPATGIAVGDIVVVNGVQHLFNSGRPRCRR